MDFSQFVDALGGRPERKMCRFILCIFTKSCRFSLTSFSFAGNLALKSASKSRPTLTSNSTSNSMPNSVSNSPSNLTSNSTSNWTLSLIGLKMFSIKDVIAVLNSAFYK